MKKIVNALLIISLVLTGAGVFVADGVWAQDGSREAACEAAGGTPDTDSEGQFVCSGDGDGILGIIGTVLDALLFLLGLAAVIMLIIGGFRYVVSGGDSTAVEGAKNTILYAIIGIVVAFLSWAAVDFVINTLQGGGPEAAEDIEIQTGGEDDSGDESSSETENTDQE